LKKADATIQLVYYFLKLIKASFTRYRKQKSRNVRFGFSSVLKTGLEPVRPNGHWILSPTCLPIPPLQHLGMF
jgi:hypothetical protein